MANELRIDVIATAQQVTDELVLGKIVVVIDVLRATSVIVTALNNGADAVIPILKPDDAFELKDSLKTEVILGGERHAEPIKGFDYGNSPLSYSTDVISGKTLVLTTTNGTLAIRNAEKANQVAIGSFLNGKAIADYLSDKKDVVLICSGNNGIYTLEDALCAGRIISLLKQKKKEVILSDLALSVEQLYEQTQPSVQRLASKGYHYKVLKQKGYEKDLEYCFTTDCINLVPRMNDNRITIL